MINKQLIEELHPNKEIIWCTPVEIKKDVWKIGSIIDQDDRYVRPIHHFGKLA